jgi:hypothetical protein
MLVIVAQGEKTEKYQYEEQQGENAEEVRCFPRE